MVSIKQDPRPLGIEENLTVVRINLLLVVDCVFNLTLVATPRARSRAPENAPTAEAVRTNNESRPLELTREVSTMSLSLKEMRSSR